MSQSSSSFWFGESEEGLIFSRESGWSAWDVRCQRNSKNKQRMHNKQPNTKIESGAIELLTPMGVPLPPPHSVDKDNYYDISTDFGKKISFLDFNISNLSYCSGLVKKKAVRWHCFVEAFNR